MSKYNVYPAGMEDEYYGREDDFYDDYGLQNLKITVVPDITTGARLNGRDFDNSLPSHLISWFENFLYNWNAYKKVTDAQYSLKMLLHNEEQPLSLALKIFSKCPGCNNLKSKNLAQVVLETTCNKFQDMPEEAKYCDDDTRMVAFNFVKTCGNVPLYKAVMKTFDLGRIRDYLVPVLKEMVSKHQHSDAAHWAILLKLTHLFDIFEIVIPLIVQDKINLAQDVLSAAPDLQLPTVQFLDSLLDNRDTVFAHFEATQNKYGYRDVKLNVLSARPMSKLIKRLATRYMIDESLIPNYSFSKACKYMHYLHYKFQNQEMGAESYRELIRDTATTKAMQMNIVQNMLEYNDEAEAVYWANYFNLAPHERPAALPAELFEHNSSGVAGSRSITNNDDFLQFPLSINCIFFVEHEPQFRKMLSYVEQHNILAFDSEWKPALNSANELSLLQLATPDRVYLLDCLSKHIPAESWRQFGVRIFNNVEILKLGFSIKQDIKMLQKSLPSLKLNFQNSRSCFLDLYDLVRFMKTIHLIDPKGESLSALAKSFLGKELNKMNQFSNWANRPLRQDQVVYAALDAYCLLQIYDVLADITRKSTLCFEDIVNEVTTSKGSGSAFCVKLNAAMPKSSIQANESSSKLQELQNETKKETKNIASKSTHCDIKFVCGFSLGELSRELRKLGFDCIEMRDNRADDHYINLVRDECRYLLTTEQRYEYFAFKLPTAQCIAISNDTPIKQVIELLDYLKIVIKPEALFSRCVHCNYDEFIAVPSQVVKALRSGQADQQTIEELLIDFVCYDFDNKQCFECNADFLRAQRTYSGVNMKIQRIKPQVLNTVPFIYVCNDCGVCTFKGAYFVHNRLLKYLSKENNLD